MYHSVIGKKLVECLNKRDGRTLTVREFFDDVYVPLFFGSSRFLQYINNSPYDQSFSKVKVKPMYTAALRDSCTSVLHAKVRTIKPDASFFLGGPAAGCTETTSGQVTDLGVPVLEDDIYASWIGAALGLTVQGGITLLIDDDEVSRYLLRNLVNEIHPTILEAASGLEGLREAKECQPGAIFLDLVMPDLSGFEVLDRLKADPTTRNIPVIVYTSQVLDDSAQARLAGAVAILSKGGSMPREAAARAIRTALVKAGWPEGIANE